jgi:beta-glucanase (GH16 family)
MECFSPGDIHHHNVFTGGYGQDMKRDQVGGKMVDPAEYHTFGVLWNEKGYTFYVDGVEDGHIDQFVSKRPEFILITTEVKGYRYEDHQPVAEAKASAGDTFLVDYVRVFDAID